VTPINATAGGCAPHLRMKFRRKQKPEFLRNIRDLLKSSLPGPTFHSANVNKQTADETAFRNSFAYENLHIRAGR
jgi:hypothetical protein